MAAARFNGCRLAENLRFGRNGHVEKGTKRHLLARREIFCYQKSAGLISEVFVVDTFEKGTVELGEDGEFPVRGQFSVPR